jgi:aminopeptidase-like protein
MMRDHGEKLHHHVTSLYPICRSITGEGLRQTLRYIAEHIPLVIHEVPSGTKVLDWEVPLEWNVRGAFVATNAGDKVIDFARHNLHLLQYSVPVDRVVSREELERHLHSLPDQPEVIPYRTSYYSSTWGFCLAHRDRVAMTDPAYRVLVDTILAPGSLTYGECVLQGGDSAEEVLVSVHSCHPSLANDNLSSIAVAIATAQELAAQSHRYTYRFLFMPGTIGAITWLACHRDIVPRIRHGLVLSCLGDAGPSSYKRSRQGNALIDRYASHVLTARGHGERVHAFSPYGYDERQYCSPGFNLPVGCLMRSRNGTFPEYHTSADNPDFVQSAALADSFEVLGQILYLIEHDTTWYATSPYGEPQLGRRGLYGDGEGYDWISLLWVLNLADGKHTLLDMAERADKPFATIAAAAAAAARAGLLTHSPHS